MATFNTTAADVLRNATLAADHFDRNTAFLLPTNSNTTTTLQLEPFGVANNQHFLTATSNAAAHHTHQTNSTSSSYTFLQIKREPCQVSEVTTSNNCLQQQHQHHQQQQHQHQQQQQQHHHLQHHHQQQHSSNMSSASLSASTSSKTMSSSTLTTLVKIEASSPKVQELDKSTLTAAPMSNTNNSVPIGIAVARKRPQESNSVMGSASAMPLQQTLSKDLNCFGIRVADIGGVSSGCGNIYFTGNGDLMTGAATADELALSGMQSVNRAPSTFWQYPSAVPIESVISMSPATVGLQYQRDASRGQVVLLPATAAALDPFQQAAAAAAAFVWPSYMTQSTATTAVPPPPNFIFPSMSSHSSLQSQQYATPLQLFGSNYLTAAAAAAAFCQHSQQTNSSGGSSTSTINMAQMATNGGSAASCSSSTSSRFLSVAATDTKRLQDAATAATLTTTTLPKHLLPSTTHQLLLPPVAQPPPLLLPAPTAALKIEEWNSNDYMRDGAKTTSTTTTLSTTSQQQQMASATLTPSCYERDKMSLSSNTQHPTAPLLQLQQAGPHQALNLMRLPTPPSSATLEGAAAASPQIIFQTAPATPALLNLSLSSNNAGAAATVPTNYLHNVSVATTMTSSTATSDEALNYKTTATSLDAQQQHLVVGVPRTFSAQETATASTAPPPQMQDVNIQTDTPLCSEDESSCCALNVAAIHNIPATSTALSSTPPPSEMDAQEASQQQQQQQPESLEPLELTTTNVKAQQCHKNDFCADTSAEATPPVQNAPEDLTGLELLSNISTSTLAKTALSVKLEPLDHGDYAGDYAATQNVEQSTSQCMENSSATTIDPTHATAVACLQQLPLSEPLGGLKLLCALAEQRIQEEEEVQSGSNSRLYQTNNSNSSSCDAAPEAELFYKQQYSPPPSTVYSLQQHQQTDDVNEEEEAAACTKPLLVVKRKKHKHSKGGKSSKKALRIACATSATATYIAHAKKSKKKCAKEKRRNKQAAAAAAAAAANVTDDDVAGAAEALDGFSDDELQADFKSAFDKVDLNCRQQQQQQFGAWPNREAIFKAMESDMRQRLAEISRQYRKKKRKLDEISLKHNNNNNQHSSKKNRKKAAKAANNAQMVGLANTLSTLGGGSGSNVVDNKFAKLLVPGSYLSPSSFMRFSDKSTTPTTSQFPPACEAQPLTPLEVTPSCSYKTQLRLEPSALAESAARSSTPQRGLKHAASAEKLSSATALHACKERKLTAARLCPNSSASGKSTTATKATVRVSSVDRELLLTSEHLYRKETRVLTDMGGLFYAGILKPLQPPDVYAITLDGERGNKSHIMSREEIFKDTILELAPNSIERVPVGTRLCAYWSQQYRCLYPGKAIETEPAAEGAQQDFVSVEFDDGDSGRIRLQNIRLLLSDYPIVEYDNPLYSLGKQKKSVMKVADDSGNTSDHAQQQGSAAADEDQHLLQQQTLDLFAQRSEKKRIKSLKKKTLASANGGSGDSTNTERMRKHHKHKKRKKHKKHHRKMCEAAAANDSISYVVETSTSYANNNNNNNSNSSSNNKQLEATDVETATRAINVKIETVPASAATATEAIKVKTEQFEPEQEEETTSNMMSEISDEAKIEDDEIEHNNSKGSKIAAFLPERQLWGWLGTAYRKAGVKGRARKQFYKTIKRGKETITVGDCAVFLSTGRPDRPYIGRIESMWETAASNKVVRVRWFYHPEETTGCPDLKYPGALFESPHEDENDVQTISHRCEVLEFSRYFDKFGADSKQYQSIYDNNDTYYLSGYYNPRLQVLKLQDDIPTLEEKQTTVD